MTSLSFSFVSAPLLRPIPTGVLKRLLNVAYAVGFVGASISLLPEWPDYSLSLPAAPPSVHAGFSTGYPGLLSLADDAELSPGASVAAYDTPVDDSAVRLTAAKVLPSTDVDTLDPGASVAAYGN